jgi:hypothetical protein
MRKLTACAAWFIPAFCLLIATAEHASAAATKDDYIKSVAARLERIDCVPAKIELSGKYAYTQLIITGYLTGGEQIDLTRLAKAVGAGSVIELSSTGMVSAKQDGDVSLTFSYSGKSVSVPVKVSGQKQPLHPNFARDVMPLMSRMGCNAGTCHGSKDGQNGFKLSLRGYDVAYDHRALTDDVSGRRFNRAAPDQSLMLLKPAGIVPHVGSVLTKPGDAYYEIIRAWIADGVKLDTSAPKVTGIEIIPKKPTIALAEMTQQMRVVATYSDGAKRDVTGEAIFSSTDTEIVEIDPSGLVTAVRRGEAATLARYEGAYAAAPLFVMGDRSGYAWKEEPANNFIDGLVYKKMQQVKVLPSGLANDAQFIRRAYIDLIGLPPTAQQVIAFLVDNRDNRAKRDALIDQLIASPDYVEHWTNKWADMLLSNRKVLGAGGTKALRGWIRGKVEANTPYDKFAYEVLTASGSTIENPAAAYFKTFRKADAVMENTTQLFLSVRFSCNKCHDHPFERWTQNQHWELAAYFAKIGRKADPKFKGKKIGGTAVQGALPLVEIIFDGDKGEVKHPNSGAVMAPSFPYTHAVQMPKDANLRQQFATWATSSENQYFAKSYVNRVWSYMLGVGIIDPVDDIRAGNPPTNPELLDRLTKEFIDHKFDVRWLMTTICKSRTYQRSIETNQWNADDVVNYAHAMARRLPAEVLFDAVHRVTGSQSKLPGMKPGARAAELPDNGAKLPDDFLAVFGRPARETSCECERAGGVMLGAVMNLVNGPTIATAIADPNSEVAKLVNQEKDDAKVVNQLFLRILNRPASKAEIAAGVEAIRTSSAAEEGKALAAAVSEYEKTLDAKQPAWEKQIASSTGAAWTPLDMQSGKSSAGATFAKQGDKSIIIGGKLANDTQTFTFHTDLVGITGVKLEAMADPKLPAKGPGRAKNGNFVLSEFKIAAATKAEPAKSQPVALQNAVADFSQQGFAVASAIDGNTGTGWATSPRFGQTNTAVFETKANAGSGGGTILTVTMQYNYTDGQHSIGRFRLSVTNSPRPIKLKGGGPPAAIVNLVKIPADKRNAQQKAQLAAHFRTLDPEFARRKQALANHSRLLGNDRLNGAQDLVWALINSPSFLFDR